jgi:hypothetical protein
LKYAKSGLESLLISFLIERTTRTCDLFVARTKCRSTLKQRRDFHIVSRTRTVSTWWFTKVVNKLLKTCRGRKNVVKSTQMGTFV